MMKKISYALVIMTILLSASSCKKHFLETEDTTPSVSFSDGVYDTSFEWKTSKTVEIVVNSDDDQIVNITSIDNKIRYHRGMLLGTNHKYTVKISIPVIVEQLNINSTPIAVGDKMNINL
jgi:hypothetical protein